MKKLLTAIILTLGLAISAVGLSACGENKSVSQDARILSIYNTYVAYAEDNGITPLSYEEWLSSIKGEKGDKGDNGKSAYEIWLDHGYEGTETDFLNWLKSGEPAVEPKEPEQPTNSPYGTYKFYSVEYDGKVWYVGDEIKGIKITEDFWNIILAPDGKTYVSVDEESLKLSEISLICIKEGREYIFYDDYEGRNFMTITVSGDTLVGVTTNPIPETLTFKKVSDDYTIPEPSSPVGGITADTDFNALESDIVSKQEFVKAFNYIAVTMDPYSCVIDNFTVSAELLYGDISEFGILKFDGNKRFVNAVSGNEKASRYLIFMEEYNSVFECSPDGVFYQEERPAATEEYERISNLAEELWENVVYNKQRKQYEIESYDGGEGVEVRNIQIKIKDGKMILFRETENDYTYCFKFYDIGNTTVNIPAAVLQKYQEVLNKKQ